MVIVGTRKDSQSYVSMKRKACAEAGIKSFDVDLPEQVLESELINKVHELNALPDVHGWSVVNLIAYLNITFHVDPKCDLSFLCGKFLRL